MRAQSVSFDDPDYSFAEYDPDLGYGVGGWYCDAQDTECPECVVCDVPCDGYWCPRWLYLFTTAQDAQCTLVSGGCNTPRVSYHFDSVRSSVDGFAAFATPAYNQGRNVYFGFREEENRGFTVAQLVYVSGTGSGIYYKVRGIEHAGDPDGHIVHGDSGLFHWPSGSAVELRVQVVAGYVIVSYRLDDSFCVDASTWNVAASWQQDCDYVGAAVGITSTENSNFGVWADFIVMDTADPEYEDCGTYEPIPPGPCVCE